MSPIEFAIVAVMLAGAVGAAAFMGRGTPVIRNVLVAVCIGLPALMFFAWTPAEPSTPHQLAPPKSDSQGYVSSDTCRACHPAQHDSWRRSYHSKMTQIADLELIQAPLETTVLTGGSPPFDRDFRVEVRDDAMWVDDVDFGLVSEAIQRDGVAPRPLPRLQGPVTMMTGSHHMQIYWVRNEQGIYRQVSWVWFIRDGRWVPTEDVYLQPPDGTLGMETSWAGNCIKCHSTGGQPWVKAVEDGHGTASTRAGELGIACESCHGPAQEHVAANMNPARRYLHHLDDQLPEPTIVNPSKLTKQRSADVCARCHSGHRHLAWDPETGTPFKSGDFMSDYFKLRRFEEVPEQFQAYFFWQDGTSRVTGREYTAMSKSGCFTRGEMTCLSCHSMHQSDPNDQLAAGMDENAPCLECHESLADQIVEHTHHPADSVGAQCMNCHMPNTTYGIMSITRSHRITSPEVVAGGTSGRPNACNLCHADQTLAWTAGWLDEWFDQPQIALSEDERQIPASALWLLRGDAMQRATAAWHLGWEPTRLASGDDWQGPLLAHALENT
jgi:predicted CXXCH cytochrome family protein